MYRLRDKTRKEEYPKPINLKYTWTLQKTLNRSLTFDVVARSSVDYNQSLQVILTIPEGKLEDFNDITFPKGFSVLSKFPCLELSG